VKRFEIGPGVTCDLDRLVDTRLSVQANSGGGKSYLLRRLLEQTHGQVQHLVIDPEGEFSSLREQFDYVLAAKQGGDTVADPRFAQLLAERLLELKVSAILDIYELKAHERIAFVRRFLEALVDAPKALWHPALVVVDECHVYCPQVGDAESAGAVKDLATRGRKRGFCAVLATQRLSKLHKDAVAECNNKLIGRTSLDVDMKRAADELGFTSKEQTYQLRGLRAGEFYAFGPAFPGIAGIARVQVGGIATTHPKAGARLAFSPPPPTSRIRALLPSLADLPAEAEERVKSVEALKREVADLRRELLAAKRAQPVAEAKTVETFVLKDGQLDRAEKLIGRLEALRDRVADHEEDLNTVAKEIRDAIASTRAPVAHIPRPTLPIPTPAPRQRHSSIPLGNGVKLGTGERKILTALAQYPDGRTTSGGRFNNILGGLRSAGYIIGSDSLQITEAGLAALGAWEPLPHGAELLAFWRQQLAPAEARVLDVVVQAYPKALSKEDVAASTDPPYEPSGGRFNNILGKLRTLELITRGHEIRASQDLFS
jgi:hypothetical protein